MPGNLRTRGLSPLLVVRVGRHGLEPTASGVSPRTALCCSDAVVEWTTGSEPEQKSPERGRQTSVLLPFRAALARETPTDVCDRHKVQTSGR